MRAGAHVHDLTSTVSDWNDLFLGTSIRHGNESCPNTPTLLFGMCYPHKRFKDGF
jgi:hypothetical protein